MEAIIEERLQHAAECINRAFGSNWDGESLANEINRINLASSASKRAIQSFRIAFPHAFPGATSRNPIKLRELYRRTDAKKRAKPNAR